MLVARTRPKDYIAEAEALFRDFAARHAFVIEKVDTPHVELMMCLPQQAGLSFELTLALQNADELNIGFEEFWSYFFPFEAKRDVVSRALDGIATGTCRLAIHRQFGSVVKRVLEQRIEGRWQGVYSAISRFQVPLLGTEVSYLYNEDARPQPR